MNKYEMLETLSRNCFEPSILHSPNKSSILCTNSPLRMPTKSASPMSVVYVYLFPNYNKVHKMTTVRALTKINGSTLYPYALPSLVLLNSSFISCSEGVPYISVVVVIDEWPKTNCSISIRLPLCFHIQAKVWRKRCG